jgi:hypothetical protein
MGHTLNLTRDRRHGWESGRPSRFNLKGQPALCGLIREAIVLAQPPCLETSMLLDAGKGPVDGEKQFNSILTALVVTASQDVRGTHKVHASCGSRGVASRFRSGRSITRSENSTE